MSHLTKVIIWLLLAMMMAVGCYIDIIEQNWFLLIVSAIAFVFDIVDAFVEFAAWSREQGRKDAQKEDENDT